MHCMHHVMYLCQVLVFFMRAPFHQASFAQGLQSKVWADTSGHVHVNRMSGLPRLYH